MGVSSYRESWIKDQDFVMENKWTSPAEFLRRILIVIITFQLVTHFAFPPAPCTSAPIYLRNDLEEGREQTHFASFETLKSFALKHKQKNVELIREVFLLR